MVKKSTPARALISPVCNATNEQNGQKRGVRTNGCTHVTERGTHDDGLVPVLLVVVEDALNGDDTRVRVANVVLARLVLLVPVKDLRAPI